MCRFGCPHPRACSAHPPEDSVFLPTSSSLLNLTDVRFDFALKTLKPWLQTGCKSTPKIYVQNCGICSRDRMIRPRVFTQKDFECAVAVCRIHEHAAPTESPSTRWGSSVAASLGLSDFSRIDLLGAWKQSVIISDEEWGLAAAVWSDQISLR